MEWGIDGRDHDGLLTRFGAKSVAAVWRKVDFMIVAELAVEDKGQKAAD